MKKALHILVALLWCGCFSSQYRVSAQSREEALPTEAETNGLANSAPTVALNATSKSPALTLVTVERVSFEGLQTLFEADVRKAFREQRVAVKAQSPFDASGVKKGVEVIRQLLEERGYFKSKVEVRIDNLSENLMAVKFIVNEGQPFVITGIQFEGNRVFTGDELRAQLKYVTAPDQEAFDRALLEYDLNNVRNYMRSRGFLQARTGRPEEQVIDDGVRVTVPIEEGLLYRMGKLDIEGARLFSPDQIREIIGLKPGDIADGKQISDALFKTLSGLYKNAGYIQYEADPQPVYRVDNKTGEGIVDLQIDIREGTAYKIAAIEFVGNKQVSTEELRRALLIHVGDVFNEQLFEESIENLNNMTSLEALDKEANVNYRTDEDTGLIELIFKLREIQEPQSP